jgi:hypothetical protein
MGAVEGKDVLKKVAVLEKARIARACERSRSSRGARRPVDVDWGAARKALPSAFESKG